MESHLKANYEDAVQVAQQVNYNAVTPGYREAFPQDDPPFNSGNDLWSRTELSDAAKNVRDQELWAEAQLKVAEMEKQGTVDFEDETDKTNYTAEEYKKLVYNKHGDKYRPFKDSTMALSLPQDEVVDAKVSYAMDQLAEITQGIESLEKALYLYNDEIKRSEPIYYTANDRASKLWRKIKEYRIPLDNPELEDERTEILNYLLSENSIAVGERDAMGTLLTSLRDKAVKVRSGLDALQQQRRVIADSVGLEVPPPSQSPSAWVGDAGKWAGGGLAGAALAIGVILWLRTSAGPATRAGRRRDPVSIFTD
jgi:hypothetical protein